MRGTVSILVKTLKDRLEALFAPAEDPRQAFDCSLDRQRQLLTKVKQPTKKQRTEGRVQSPKLSPSAACS